MATRPVYLSVCLSLCRALAAITSTLHYTLLRTGIIKAPGWFTIVSPGRFKNCQSIWCARITRRFISVSVRSIFRKDVIRLVDPDIQFPQDSGCVVVVCHTPWKRLLIQSCMDKLDTLIIANGHWIPKRKHLQNRGAGFTELKKAVDHLNHKGRIFITADVFNESKDCPVNFLGKDRNLSLLPVRLSRAANVPLLMVIPVFCGNAVRFIKGPYLKPQDNAGDSFSVMRNLIYYLESEIKKDPSIWPEYVG